MPGPNVAPVAWANYVTAPFVPHWYVRNPMCESCVRYRAAGDEITCRRLRELGAVFER